MITSLILQRAITLGFTSTSGTSTSASVEVYSGTNTASPISLTGSTSAATAVQPLASTSVNLLDPTVSFSSSQLALSLLG